PQFHDGPDRRGLPSAQPDRPCGRQNLERQARRRGRPPLRQHGLGERHPAQPPRRPRIGGLMAPVFGHGRLRLYLLKLLEESPRHGYEVIRLLQDRFLGVYSPSPGTIYPRLARLEEEGLVTHEVIKGKKIYSVTDKGRAELERRMDELAELEDEITASAPEFAREVQED